MLLPLLSLLGLVAGSQAETNNGRLGVYGPVPGLAPSPYYQLQVGQYFLFPKYFQFLKYFLAR